MHPDDSEEQRDPEKGKQASLTDIFILPKALQLSEAEPLTARRCQTHWGATYTALHLFKAAAEKEDEETFILHLGM